jgi:hypothetical protein
MSDSPYHGQILRQSGSHHGAEVLGEERYDMVGRKFSVSCDDGVVFRCLVFFDVTSTMGPPNINNLML